MSIPMTYRESGDWSSEYAGDEWPDNWEEPIVRVTRVESDSSRTSFWDEVPEPTSEVDATSLLALEASLNEQVIQSDSDTEDEAAIPPIIARMLNVEDDDVPSSNPTQQNGSGEGKSDDDHDEAETRFTAAFAMRR